MKPSLSECIKEYGDLGETYAEQMGKSMQFVH